MKKGPMYTSNISNSQYEFADYTTPDPNNIPLSNLTKVGKLKYSSMLNSQLIGIEQSREEDAGDGVNSGQKGLFEVKNYQQSFLDTSNLDTILREPKLDYYRSVKATQTINISDSKIRKMSQKNFGNYSIENIENTSLPIDSKKKDLDYTSSQILSLMISPYKDNLQLLLKRVHKLPRKLL